MRKFIFTLCFLAFALGASAQEEKPEAVTPASLEMSALATASSLAKYGYANFSPTALIEAARIFSSIEVQESELEKTSQSSEVAEDKEKKISFDPVKLIADAKVFAEGDKLVLDLAESVENTFGKGQSRGMVGGPRILEDVVRAKASVSYTGKFWVDELAEVCVSGDGDTDLDLYVYDANGNLIGSDTDYSDDCVVRWVPAWTGTFVIKVVNRGILSNVFHLWTN